jgi:hypothetical protein
MVLQRKPFFYKDVIMKKKELLLYFCMRIYPCNLLNVNFFSYRKIFPSDPPRGAPDKDGNNNDLRYGTIINEAEHIATIFAA